MVADALRSVKHGFVEKEEAIFACQAITETKPFGELHVSLKASRPCSIYCPWR